MGFIDMLVDDQDLLSWATNKLENAEDKGHDLVLDSLNVYAAVAEVLAPFKLGGLRDSTTVEILGLEGTVYPTAFYAFWVIMGRGEVRPVTKRALWWPELGNHAVMYAKPAAPNDYFQISFDTSDWDIEKLVDQYGEWFTT